MKKFFLIFCWGLYDLSNQFFSVNVVSLYFVRWLTLEKKVPEIYYSLSFGASLFIVAFLAPVLGRVSDVSQRRRPFLIYFTMLSIAFTMILGAFDNVLLALLFFAIANLGCQMGIVFYNALIVNVAARNKIGLVSGFGRMLGYSGAVLALFIAKPLVLTRGYQSAFFATGVSFFVFSLPCLIFVKDKLRKHEQPLSYYLRKERPLKIFRRLKDDLSDTGRFPGLLDLLKASFCGLCAVNVVILFMSVYASRVFGLNEAQVINIIAFSTIFAILGSIISGYISDHIGYKRSLSIIFVLWGIGFVVAALARSSNLYWFVGALVGTALGGTWVVLRALAVKLAPPDRVGEIFGLFNLIGYFSAIVGAVFWGVIVLLLRPLGACGYRIALLSLTLFMLFGIIFLLRLPEK